MITGKLYDYLKWLTQVVLPAVGTLYVALAALWSLPAALEVSGTILAIDAFLGVLLGISQVNYNKQIEPGGTLFVAPDGRRTFTLNERTMDLENLGDKEELRFNVVKGGQGPGEDELGNPA